MNKTQITAETGVPLIIVTRAFDAPRDLVFRAHTDPELLVRWLGPRDLTLTEGAPGQVKLDTTTLEQRGDP